LHESEDNKRDNGKEDEDEVTYADLDKSALGGGKKRSAIHFLVKVNLVGNKRASIEDERTEYAEIEPKKK